MEKLTCPQCDGAMVSRVNKTTGQRFWGCASYPKCSGTRNTDGEAPWSKDREDFDSELPSERQRKQDRSRW